MGGAANTVARVATDVGTLGLNEIQNIPGTGKAGRLVSNIANIGSLATPSGMAMFGVGSLARTTAGIQTLANAPRDAARQEAAAQQEQERQAAAAEQRLLQQPKNVAPDNFLANKTRMLQNMRLGLLSTIPGAGGASASAISAPSLMPTGQGRPKLGS